MRIALAAVVGLAASFLFACTATPAGQDLTSGSDGNDPSPDPVPPCIAISNACDSGEARFASRDACIDAGAQSCRAVGGSCGSPTYYCGRTTAQCLAVPSCDAGDTQVSACAGDLECYTRTVCGTTIRCARPPAQCDAYPSCDPGDPEVTDVSVCKQSGLDCYSRTLCGSTIWCANTK